MAVILRTLILFLALYSTSIIAQDKTAVSLDPLNLDFNWWSHFEPAEALEKDELSSRADKLMTSLQQLLNKTEVEQKKQLSPLVKKIESNFKQYIELRFAEEKDLVNIPLPSEKYTIEQALQRFLLWRKIKREMDLEDDDLTWQNAQIALERKRQAQQKSDYLKLPISDPQRLPQGITVIASRTGIELNALQIRKRANKLKVNRIEARRLEEELKNIYDRLVPSEVTPESWLTQSEKEKNSANEIREKPGKTSTEPALDTPLGSANNKLLLMANAESDIRISLHELTSSRYQLLAILEQALKPENGSQAQMDDLAKLLNSFQEYWRETETHLSPWNSMVTQTRNLVSEQTTNLDINDPKLLNTYKRLLKQVELIEQRIRDLKQEHDIDEFVMQIAQAKIRDEAGLFTRLWMATESSIGGSWDLVLEWLNASLFEINEVPVTSMGIIRVFVIILFAFVISKLLRRGIEKIGNRKGGVSTSARYTLGRIVHYVVLIVGTIIGLSSIGIDFTKFAIFASALGVGIGFGLQTLISNFVAGLIILFERSLKVGDFVELSSGLAGEVKEINMRSTLITTNDNIDILVPNSELVNNQVTNWTLREAQRRIHVPFGVAYGTDKDLVRKAALEAAETVKWTLKTDKHRQPQVWFVQFGDSSLNFELVVWLIPEAVKRPGVVQATYLWEIDTMLRKYNIEIPFPQRDLHVRSVFGQKDHEGLALINRQPVPDASHE